MLAKLSVVCQKQSNDSYFAICPELRGCYTQGDTYEEALANLKELACVTIKEEIDEIIKTEIFAEKTHIFSEMVLEI